MARRRSDSWVEVENTITRGVKNTYYPLAVMGNQENVAKALGPDALQLPKDQAARLTALGTALSAGTLSRVWQMLLKAHDEVRQAPGRGEKVNPHEGLQKIGRQVPGRVRVLCVHRFVKAQGREVTGIAIAMIHALQHNQLGKAAQRRRPAELLPILGSRGVAWLQHQAQGAVRKRLPQ